MHFKNRVWFMGNVEKLHSDRSQVNFIIFSLFPVPKTEKRDPFEDIVNV